MELIKENVFLNTREKKDYNFLGFSYFKIFWKKIFSKKYIFISLFVIIINAFITVTLLPGYSYFSVFLILSIFMIVFLLYLNFFSFRESHYYRFLKNEKHFDLKVYLNLFFAIFIFSLIAYGIMIFISWIFNILEFGVVLQDITDPNQIFTRTFNQATWQWSFITYNFILTIFLSFALCLFVQQIFNSQKKFFLFLLLFLIYFITNIIVNNIIFHAYYVSEWQYTYDAVNNKLIIFENSRSYYNFSNNTLYAIPTIRSESERNFFQMFTIFTNPFYANALFIDLSTSLNMINYHIVDIEQLEVIYQDIGGKQYILGGYGDFNVRVDFTQFTYNTSVDLNNYVNYWFYFSLPYIWIAFFVIWSFLIKWLRNNRSYNT